jgi:hypothetical protein
MPSATAPADTSLTRADLRLMVLAQWVRAGLDLMRGARTTGQGLFGAAVALWRLAQAVRLAMELARRLGEARGVRVPRAPAADTPPDLVFPGDTTPPNAAALHAALAELATAIADALGVARHRGASFRDREPLGSPLRPTTATARDPGRRPYGRRTPPGIGRVDRPPGAEPPGRRRTRSARALETNPPPIAALAIGRAALAMA